MIMHLVYPPTLLGKTVVPREIEDNAYAKFYGLKKVHYGLCENGEN